MLVSREGVEGCVKVDWLVSAYPKDVQWKDGYKDEGIAILQPS
jgi:hypothetical protein